MVDFANPCDYDSWTRTRLFYWSLGAYGSTHVYTWADSYESAEEEMLEWVDDNAPGLLHWVETEEDEVDMIMVGHTTLEHGNAIPSWEVHVREVTGDTRKRAVAASRAICERDDAPNLPALQDNPSPKSGYAYQLEKRRGSWNRAPDDAWETVMFTPTDGRAMLLGRRHIDGSEVNVWSIKTANGRSKIIAQTTVMTGRLLANQTGAAPWILGAILVGGVFWWLTRAKPASAAPAKPPCPITEPILASYVKTKPTTYKLYLPPDHVTTPVAAWPPAKPEYLANPNEHAFSLVDCGFYRWDGTKWVSDETENVALAKHIDASVVKGPRMLSAHPASSFLP
jgi:hypothetical protein